MLTINPLADAKKIAEFSQFLAFAAVFYQSRSAHYPDLVTLARRADVYAEQAKRPKVLAHLIAYEKKPASLKRASLLIEFMRVHGWFKAIFYANGRVVRNKHNLVNWLTCFEEAEALKDARRAHCNSISATWNESVIWRTPCRRIEATLNEKSDQPFEAQIMADANRRLADRCPYFDKSVLKEITPIENRPRFWSSPDNDD